VQAFLSSHWPLEVQQPLTAPLPHVLALQVSVVQALLSLHCAAVVQQLATGAC
jgi:hypothetical protein